MSTLPHVEIVPLYRVPGYDASGDMNTLKPVALVVDDERIIADTLSIILGKHGFATLTAYDGEAALALARNCAPDLLVSDVMMGPGIDGTELAMALLEFCPHCKVLLFSGHSATKELLEKASRAGHNFTLLAKPLHPAELLERLKNTFDLAVTA